MTPGIISMMDVCHHSSARARPVFFTSFIGSFPRVWQLFKYFLHVFAKRWWRGRGQRRLAVDEEAAAHHGEGSVHAGDILKFGCQSPAAHLFLDRKSVV